jgi:hypothetical protein
MTVGHFRVLQCGMGASFGVMGTRLAARSLTITTVSIIRTLSSATLKLLLHFAVRYSAAQRPGSSAGQSCHAETLYDMNAPFVYRLEVDASHSRV